jgi:uncharacterized repeat protein (TIGR03803 family)
VGNGVVFQMVKSKNRYKYSAIHSFPSSGSDGQYPNATLLLRDGKLYGTTAGGNPGFGTLFELTPTKIGWTERILYNFTGGADGNDPLAGLVADSEGNLYGTTTNGGSFKNENCQEYGCGVIFKVKP